MKIKTWCTNIYYSEEELLNKKQSEWQCLTLTYNLIFWQISIVQPYNTSFSGYAFYLTVNLMPAERNKFLEQCKMHRTFKN